MSRIELPEGVVPRWQEKLWMNRLGLRDTCRKFSPALALLLAEGFFFLLAWIACDYYLDPSTDDKWNRIAIFFGPVAIPGFFAGLCLECWWSEIFCIRAFPYCTSCGKTVIPRMDYGEVSYVREVVETGYGDMVETKLQSSRFDPYCPKCGNHASYAETPKN